MQIFSVRAVPLRFVWQYVDDLQDMIDGEITKISPTFPEDGIPTVAIEGHTLLHRLHGTNNTRTFQKMSDKDIVEKIARDANLQADAEDPQIQYEYVMQLNQTDLEFLRARARQLHSEILVQDKKLIFRRSQEQKTKTYTLVWAHAQRAVAMGSKDPAPENLQPANERRKAGYQNAITLL